MATQPWLWCLILLLLLLLQLFATIDIDSHPNGHTHTYTPHCHPTAPAHPPSHSTASAPLTTLPQLWARSWARARAAAAVAGARAAAAGRTSCRSCDAAVIAVVGGACRGGRGAMRREDTGRGVAAVGHRTACEYVHGSFTTPKEMQEDEVESNYKELSNVEDAGRGVAAVGHRAACECVTGVYHVQGDARRRGREQS
eukprot:655531-Pelagomonas_calceolata.AAC.9